MQLDAPWLADIHGRPACIWEETMEVWLRAEWEGWKGEREELRRGDGGELRLGCKNRTTKTKQQKRFNFFLVVFIWLVSFIFETQSCFVAQAILKLVILHSQFHECCDYNHEQLWDSLWNEDSDPVRVGERSCIPRRTVVGTASWKSRTESSLHSHFTH